MTHDRKQNVNPLVRWFVTNTVLTGFFALMWLLLRSGAQPNRLAYPCQQAAFTTASLAFGAPLVAALVTARDIAFRLLGSRRALGAAAVGLFATIGLWGFLTEGDATGVQDVHLMSPPGYRAEIFDVTECPVDPVGDRFIGLENLLKLMGRENFKIYESPTVTPLAGPDGIIGPDDVVVIKINYQWAGCGGTNTDLLNGLIRVLVDHPDGFTGEIVVGENTQFASSDNFDRDNNNARDRELSPLDVVIGFQDQGYDVSISDWRWFREFEADEGLSCDLGQGYVVSPSAPGLNVSYPRFRTLYGTCVSLKHGVWNADAGRYDRYRLKVINLPVLKPHGMVYGVTGAVKNYMGVVTTELNTRSHNGVRGGLMGTVMAEIGMPDLTILDCIRVVGHPAWGPGVGCGGASRLDRLGASTDPVALDMWATTNILVPEFLANGHSRPWQSPSPDPEKPTGAFRVYLDNSMDQLLAGGISVTNDLTKIDVHSWDGVPAPRHTAGRVGH